MSLNVTFFLEALLCSTARRSIAALILDQSHVLDNSTNIYIIGLTARPAAGRNYYFN